MSDYQYKTREVRDLAWACFSPPLLHSEKLSDDGQYIANCGLGLTRPRENWLQRLDNQPAALLKHLNVLHNGRLGLYFESLWHFFLEQDTQVDLLAHNLAVRDEGRTIGEFDCLYYCRQRDRYFHLELAVKYYLSHRQTTTNQRASHWNEWLGPTNTDHLDRKIKHLTQHQIRLGEHPAARQPLEQLGIDTLTKEVEIKGYLFQSLSDPLPPPRAYNEKNKLSRWLTVDQLPAYLEAQDNHRYKILSKPHWLAPARLAGFDENELDRDGLCKAISEYFEQPGRAKMVATIDDEGTEFNRFFVTDTAWPTQANQENPLRPCSPPV